MKLKPSLRTLLSALAFLGLTGTVQAQALKLPKKNSPLPNATDSSSSQKSNSGKLSNSLGASSADEPFNDGIVAVVNVSIITNNELNRQVAQIEQQMSRRGVPLPDRTTLRKQVLERMVLEKAQLLLAAETGIRIDDAQVESAMNAVAQQNNMSLEQFLERIKTTEGISPDRFREDVRNELTLGRLRERDVESKIQVTEAEIQTYLASKNQGNATTVSGPEVNWVQLLIKLPGNPSNKAVEQAQAQAADIEKQLRDGARLDDILKARPELTIQGTGAMGWQSYDAVPTLFTNFLTSGTPKSVNTVRSPNGFHVLQVLDRRDGKGQTTLDSTPVTQTHARHILIRVSPDVTEAEAKRRLNFVLEQIRGGSASFETLAKRYSQDGSANKGGDLGWLYPGDTVPEFEREMDALKPNGISGVFQSRFGFHVVQVLERRQQAASEERQRQEARQAIRIKKSDESYQEWLRQLRDRTFIDIRL